MAGKSANHLSYDAIKKNSTKQLSPEEQQKETEKYYKLLRQNVGIFICHDYVDDKGKPIEFYRFTKTSTFLCLTD